MKIPARLFRQHIPCMFVLLAGLLSTPSLCARQSKQGGDAPGWPITNPDTNHNRPTTDPSVGMQRPSGTAEESCSIWDGPSSSRSAVSAARLEVPGKARDEYTKACGDLRHKKLTNAESHLHIAVEQYQPYADAWVLLGEVLEAENHVDQAQSACSEATRADSNYTPGYLCLADVAGQQKQWRETLDMANRALAITSEDVYGYFYTALAQFHLNHLKEAEANALQTIDADRPHRVPQAHLLLAQIYGAKQNPRDAATQLRAYLKLVPNSPDSPQLRIKLAELESQIQKQAD
jgi:tetratricopeptide (TPR) repeat protein